MNNNFIIQFLTCYTSGLAAMRCGFCNRDAACTFSPTGHPKALLGVIFVGRIFISGAFNMIYMYTSELFPTDVRNSVVGSASSMGRISGLIAAFVGGPLVSINPLTFSNCKNLS